MSAAVPVAVFPSPLVLLASACWPIAVLKLPVWLATSVTAPTAVLLSPVVVFSSASRPKAVLLKPPTGVWTTFWSASEPPAVLLFPSLIVGFGGPPQLGVLCSMRASPVAIVRRRAMFLMGSSLGRAARRCMGAGL